MLAIDVIEPAQIELAAHIVFMLKKDGMGQICVT